MNFNRCNNEYPEYLFKLISNEEKIFDDNDEEYNNNNNNNLYKRIQKKKKENKKAINPLQKLQSKIYKNDNKSLAKIQDAKKKKATRKGHINVALCCEMVRNVAK